MLPKKKVKIEPIVSFSEILKIADKNTNEAVVIEVGEDCEVEVGMKVIISPKPLVAFNNEDGCFMIVDEEQILAVIQ